MVGPLVLIVELQVIGEVLGDPGHLDVLPHHLPAHPEPQLLIGADQLAEVLPAPGRGEFQPARPGLHPVEVILFDVQIGHHRPVDAPSPGVLLPDGEVLRHIDALHPVQRHHVKVPDGAVVLRRVSRRRDEPALRQPLVAEGLALEELEHHGGQGLRDAVDLIQEEDALFQAGFFHQLVHGGQNLTHGVLGDRVLLPAVNPLLDHGQAHGALAGVVGNGVGHQTHAALRGDLLHNLGLADARRPHQQHGPLPDGGNEIVAQGVSGEIGL